MAEMRVKDYISRNLSLKRENQELRAQLAKRKAKSVRFRLRCACKAFFSELNNW